jgi:AcrR family transcriptional regulator
MDERVSGLMKAPFKQNKEVDAAHSPAGSLLSARDRILQVACELFAKTGFHGTHLREISQRAETNVAGVCYHFHSKEGLYQAVILEAGRRLSADREDLIASRHLSPEQRLLKLTESLLERLSAEHLWIAKLMTRELMDVGCGGQNYAAPWLEREFVLLQAVMKDLLGTKANQEIIRLHALSVLSECVFYCLAGENQDRALVPLGVCLPSRARLARFITQRSLGALQREGTEPEISNA